MGMVGRINEGTLGKGAGDWWTVANPQPVALPSMSEVVWIGTEDATVTATTDETTLVADGQGTLTLPPWRLVSGTRLRFDLTGYYSTSATASTAGRWRVYLSPNGNVATVVLDTGAITLPPTGGGVWRVQGELVCRQPGVGGTLSGWLVVTFYQSDAAPPLALGSAPTSVTGADDSRPQDLDVTFQWDSADADNKLVSTTMSAEVSL